MKKIWLGCFFLIGGLLSGQHPYFYQLNEEDKLPSNEVYDLTQDDFGYIWMGCDAGLFRYDGFFYEKRTFANQNNVSISNLKKGPFNDIWCQNFSGQIFHQNVENDSLSLAFDASTLSGTYPSFTIDSRGRAWIATDSSIFVIDQDHRLTKSISGLEMGLGATKWASICMLDEDFIVAVNYRGELFVIENETFGHKKLGFFPQALGRFQLYFLEEDELILSCEYEKTGRKSYEFHQIHPYDVEYRGEFTPRENSQNILNIRKIDGRTFLCTSNGLSEIDDHFQILRKSNSWFSDERISSVFKDREGNYWFTTLQDGMMVVPNPNILIYNQENSALTDQNITALYLEDENNLILGTYHGTLFKLDLSTSKISPWVEKSGSANRAVQKIQKLNDEIFVARGPFSVLKPDASSVIIPQINNCRDFALQGDTLFYFRSDLCGYLVQSQGKWENTVLRKKGGKSIAISQDGKTVFYLFTDGLYTFSEGNFQELKFEGKPVSGNLLLTHDQEIWIGTINAGMISWDGKEFSRKFSLDNGLFDNEVKSFLIQNNLLVVATRLGLSLLDLSTGKYQQINEFDGLAFKEIADMVLVNDKLFLATLKGLVVFPLEIATQNPVAPFLAIEGLSLNGNPLPNSAKINLSYNDVNLEVKLSSTALRSRGEYFYAYRIQNLSKDWVQVPANQHKLTFTSFQPGNYLLEVVALNEDGVRSPTRQIEIIVHSPIWQKTWFYLLLTLLAILVASGIFLWRIRFIRRRAFAQNRLTASKLTALKAQMNPHFMFNTLNSLQDLILKQDFKSTNYYLSKYASLMRMILNHSEKKEIDITEEVKMLDFYLQLEKMRFGDDFEYHIHCQPEANEMEASLPPMIIQPFVENALKHGLLHKKGKKELKIEFMEEKDQVICTITDNGIGRKRSAEINARQRRDHQSFSMEATEKRIDLLKNFYGKQFNISILDLENGTEPEGTQVVLTFPKHG